MNLYSTIGRVDKNGKVIFSTGYKLERFWRHLRQWFAFVICPEAREKIDRERYNLDYIIRVRKNHTKDMRGRDKAIARLQKERKEMRRVIKELKRIGGSSE